MLSKFFLKQTMSPAIRHRHLVFNNFTQARAILPSNLSSATFFTTSMNPHNSRQIVKQMDAARFFSSSSSDIDSGSEEYEVEAEETSSFRSAAKSSQNQERNSQQDQTNKFMDVRNLVENINSGEFDAMTEYQLMVQIHKVTRGFVTQRDLEFHEKNAALDRMSEYLTERVR